MKGWRQFLAASDHRVARSARAVRRGYQQFTLPVPVVVVRPMLWVYIGLRGAWYTFRRVFVAEPLFKAACTRYGRRVRTDIFVHWIQGKGQLILGDDVAVDGKCSFTFASRFAESPIFRVGDRSGIGHNCSFTIGKCIAIGADCRIASDVWMFDSPGHPSDPAARMAGHPTAEEEVRPVSIGNNVWIGRRCIIFPGVTIGENSIVVAGSVVMTSVQPNSIVAGNPARRIGTLGAAPPAPETTRRLAIQES